MCTICNDVFSIFFADDSNIFKSDKDLYVIEQVLNSELNKIAIWLKANKLYMNVSKTQYMIFSGRKNQNHSVKLRIEGNQLTCVNKSKFLGVVIDNKLSWKDHVSHVKNKVSKGIGIIAKAKPLLCKKSLLSLYYSFVYPHLSYCNHIWGKATSNCLNELIVKQKMAVRIISGVAPRSSTAPLFENLKILNLDQIHNFLVGQMMFKYYQKKLPEIFNDFFTCNRDVHNHDTRQRLWLHPPKFDSELGLKSVAFQGVRLWNKIISSGMPLHISHMTFKKQLKSLILTNWNHISLP